MSLPHEKFIDELYALCVRHRVTLQETEDNGILIAPTDGCEDFSFFQMDPDGPMQCQPARINEFGALEPDWEQSVMLEGKCVVCGGTGEVEERRVQVDRARRRLDQ